MRAPNGAMYRALGLDAVGARSWARTIAGAINGATGKSTWVEATS